MENEISEVTRRTIVDYIVVSGISWSGRLEDGVFLARLYNLASMPSTDRRVGNAAADIQQHRGNWQDWPDDWVFSDSRFRILDGPDSKFLEFLCETIHPVVRPKAQEVETLLGKYNEALAVDGWELSEASQISGRPVFAPQRRSGRVQVFQEPTGWQKVDRQTQEVRIRLHTADTEEKFQTVGLLCREVLITSAQQVYDRSRHPSRDGVPPSDSDAGRMLEAFFASELNGGENEEVRAHAKAALRLALALQHKRTADFRMAALCAEATMSVVNIVAVLGGRRHAGPGGLT